MYTCFAHDKYSRQVSGTRMHTYGKGVVVPEKGPSGEGSFERARLVSRLALACRELA